MHIKVVFISSAVLFTAVTKETLYHCCSISATYFQKVGLHLIQLVCLFWFIQMYFM